MPDAVRRSSLRQLGLLLGVAGQQEAERCSPLRWHGPGLRGYNFCGEY